jgi:hypothetical protein
MSVDDLVVSYANWIPEILQNNMSDVLSRPVSTSTYPAPMTTIFIGRARKALGMRLVSIVGGLPEGRLRNFFEKAGDIDLKKVLALSVFCIAQELCLNM